MLINELELVFFEDKDCENLRPLNYFKHTAFLKIGIRSIFEKYTSLSRNIKFLGRPHLLNLFTPIPEKEYLFINARLIPNSELINKIKLLKNGDTIKFRDLILATKISFEAFKNKKFFNIIEYSTEFNILERPWDIIRFNSVEIKSDLNQIEHNFNNEKNVYIHKSSTVNKFVDFNTENGPIIIDSNATIDSFTKIIGPVYIGKHSQIKSHSLIINSSIHFNCRISGEISSSVIFDYTNKSHYGFLGHSVVGDWCNLGAGTTNSNLKNNYGSIRVDHFGDMVDTKLTFLGLIMGDHSKTAIGTMFNTGTICGVFSNVFENIKDIKLIPSFSWGGKSNSRYEFDKILDSVQRYTPRRDVVFDQKNYDQIRFIFSNRDVFK